jgi:hypothetical protein
MQVSTKSGSYEEYFSREDERIFSPYLASQCSGVTQKRHVTLVPQVQQPVQVWLKSDSIKQQFTPVDEIALLY